VVNPAPHLLDRLLLGDLRALSRLVTRVEHGGAEVLAWMEQLWDRRSAARVLGVTGPPGAGKSTFVDRLISHHRAADRRVAVLAVDPSSPFTGGAILGDRIRMQRHAADPGVFIRSLGTRGHHGGLTRATREAAVLCSAAGFDRIVIETVGVGQTELDVVSVADQVLVLLVPESGDVVQTMKAGLLEAADLFAVNKADRPGSDKLLRELRAMLDERAEVAQAELPEVPLFGVSAARGDGLDELLAELDARDARLASPLQRPPATDLALRIVGEETTRRVIAAPRGRRVDGGDLADLARALEAGEVGPYAVARALLGSDDEP